MAIIMEFRASNGALIKVDDSAIAGVSKEEMDRRVKRMLDVAKEVAINNAIRRAEAERLKQKEGK